jgi:hypothetical protein
MLIPHGSLVSTVSVSLFCLTFNPTYPFILVYGGGNSKIASVPTSATAYANRDAFITYQFYASSGNQSFPSDGISFVTNMLNSLEPNVTAACWSTLPFTVNKIDEIGLDPNYVDPTLTSAQWKEQYYGSNYPRLLGYKNMYDKYNIFDYPQAIGHP